MCYILTSLCRNLLWMAVVMPSSCLVKVYFIILFWFYSFLSKVCIRPEGSRWNLGLVSWSSAVVMLLRLTAGLKALWLLLLPRLLAEFWPLPGDRSRISAGIGFAGVAAPLLIGLSLMTSCEELLEREPIPNVPVLSTHGLKRWCCGLQNTN